MASRGSTRRRTKSLKAELNDSGKNSVSARGSGESKVPQDGVVGEESSVEGQRSSVIEIDSEIAVNSEELEGSVRQSSRRRKQRQWFDPSTGLREISLVGAKRKERREEREGRREEREGECTPKRPRGKRREVERGDEDEGREEEEVQGMEEGGGEGMAEGEVGGRDERVKKSHLAPDDTEEEQVFEYGESGGMEMVVGLEGSFCGSHFKSLCELLPGRSPQIGQLLTLLGEVGQPVESYVSKPVSPPSPPPSA